MLSGWLNGGRFFGGLLVVDALVDWWWAGKLLLEWFCSSDTSLVTSLRTIKNEIPTKLLVPESHINIGASSPKQQ